MKTYILVLDKDDEQHQAVLYESDADSEPLAACPVAANVPDLSRRFRETKAGNELLALGQEVYDLVAPALDPYISVRATRERARLLLNIRDESLSAVPWELMVDGGAALFRNAKFPVCRLWTSKQSGWQPQDGHDWPPRMLIVVGSEADDSRVAAEQEIELIVDAIVPHEAAVDWKLLERPTREQLAEEIEQFEPHVFHFIGHGGLSRGQPVLKLFDPKKNKDYNWDVTTLRDDLAGNVGRLRLAYLNACRTAEAAEDGLWSVSNVFLDAGATAVVATRAEVSGEAAARSAGAFYTELLKDLTVDVAMVRARKKIGVLRERDWAALSLELRLPPPELFASCETLHAEPDRIRRHFWQVCKYVGRQDVYRKAWKARLAEQKRPALIKGESRIGKTAAVEMLLERCILADHEVRYVDMKDRGNEYVALMRATLEGDDQASSLKPHIQPFPTHTQTSFEELRSATLGDPENRMPKNVDKLFDGFCRIIEEAYPDKHILLVYDHLDDMEKTYLRDTLAHFAHWHRRGGSVHTVMILSDLKVQELQSMVFIDEPEFHVMTIDRFKPERYMVLSKEFVRRLVIARCVHSGSPISVPEDYRKWAIDSVAAFQPDVDWSPDTLSRIEDVMVGIGKLKKVPSG